MAGSVLGRDAAVPVKYNGNCIVNDNPYLSEGYLGKIAEVQNELLTEKEYVVLYERAPQMKVAEVSEYRQLASFGDTVLAAKCSENHGFEFVTWKRNTDGNAVFWGDYSPSYEYAKESFAVRSGLISESRLFSEQETANLFRCVDFAKQLTVHNRCSNNLPMRPLHWLSPMEFAVQYV